MAVSEFPIYINDKLSFATSGEIRAVMEACTFFDIDDAAIYIDSPISGLTAYSAVPGHKQKLQQAMQS